jgi:hypothetical protein
MKINGITRSEFKRLMSIPEAKSIFDAQVVQLKLLFKEKLQQQEEPNYSNLIQFPVKNHLKVLEPHQDQESPKKNVTTIVDADCYLENEESEQIKIFMDYFDSHKQIRKTLLEYFFLRLLPYSAVIK